MKCDSCLLPSNFLACLLPTHWPPSTCVHADVPEVTCHDVCKALLNVQHCPFPVSPQSRWPFSMLTLRALGHPMPGLRCPGSALLQPTGFNTAHASGHPRSASVLRLALGPFPLHSTPFTDPESLLRSRGFLPSSMPPVPFFFPLTLLTQLPLVPPPWLPDPSVSLSTLAVD